MKDPLFGLNPILSFDGDSSRREFSITFTTKDIPLVSTGATQSGALSPVNTSTGTVQ
ncbi:MAG TPA: hypothetical protein PLY22_02980 [Fervidobacterium sp.]|nr:hypothetical protein [Fervidobacterium sp.]